MEENKEAKNTNSSYPNDTDVKQTTLHLGGQNTNSSSTYQNPTKSARISAHSLRWTWDFKGTTSRKPDNERRMRNWTGRIYYFERCTVILNVSTMEIYTHSRPYKSTERMIYANWGKADRIAREFSEFAQIAITPIHNEHPADVASAHLVINQKGINRRFLPGKANSKERRAFIGKNEPYASAARVGAIEDGSHPGKVELVGRESVEGGMGLDWLLLDYPSVVRQSLEMNAMFSKNLDLHLSVLKRMDKSLEELTKAVRRLK